MMTQIDRKFKDELFTEFSRVGKALSSGRRLELIDVLAQSERSVEDLANETGMSIANTSHHLQVLRRARLVETRQEGTHVYYRLAGKCVFQLWQTLREVGEFRIAEITQITREYLEERERFEPIRMADLVERLKTEGVIVLDVRPASEYAAGHIASARSLPLEELDERLAEFSADAEVVAYCRGPYCVLADEAVERLRRHGVRARRLDLGFPDWQVAGFPVERRTDTR